MRGPWAALGWPLGHPWVTQGSPNPNPKQAEGRNQKPCGAKLCPGRARCWLGVVEIRRTQIVIVSERRSREPNDPEWRSLPIPIADCYFFKDRRTSRPGPDECHFHLIVSFFVRHCQEINCLRPNRSQWHQGFSFLAGLVSSPLRYFSHLSRTLPNRFQSSNSKSCRVESTSELSSPCSSCVNDWYSRLYFGLSTPDCCKTSHCITMFSKERFSLGHCQVNTGLFCDVWNRHYSSYTYCWI
jgi:hypothetical protein